MNKDATPKLLDLELLKHLLRSDTWVMREFGWDIILKSGQWHNSLAKPLAESLCFAEDVVNDLHFFALLKKRIELAIELGEDKRIDRSSFITYSFLFYDFLKPHYENISQSFA